MSLDLVKITELILAVYRCLSLKEKQEALDAIDDELNEWVFYHVSRLVNNAADAENITQEVRVEIVTRIYCRKWDPAKSVRTYITNIISSKVGDHWRTKKHEKTEPDEDLSLDTGTREISDSCDILHMTKTREIHEAIFREEAWSEFHRRLKLEKHYERLLAVLETQYKIHGEIHAHDVPIMRIKQETCKKFDINYGTFQNDVKRLAHIADECGILNK